MFFYSSVQVNPRILNWGSLHIVYNPISHVNKDYPASFLLGSEYRTDMVSLNKALKQAGVENELVDPLAEEGLEKPHGFVANLRTDPVSAKAFERLITFINDRTKE
ncbi:hypothetical protein HCC04_11855 [Streptococcus suis]|nr:hypothetical protein [Streptococcus suis]